MAESWLGATAETTAVTIVLATIWYPVVATANALAGTPVGGDLVGPALFALALGSAYPFVAGGWSIGDLGEFCFLLLVAGLAWGVVTVTVVAASGAEFTGSDPLPQVALGLPAYAIAYVLAFRTDVQVFR